METIITTSTMEQTRVDWYLNLYVAGNSPKSITALNNIESICKKYLNGTYTIQVIDVLVNPHLANEDQIVALPTLVRKLPPPLRKAIGDLSNTEKVLTGLQILSRG